MIDDKNGARRNLLSATKVILAGYSSLLRKRLIACISYCAKGAKV